MTARRSLPPALLLCVALAPCIAASEEPPTAAPPIAPTAATTMLPPVRVVGVTPLPGLDLPQDRIPAPVQTATGTEIERSGALSLADFMNRRFGSVHVNETQGNPFQPDLSYRGYTASPLLGTPQGLSLYVDGIRQNQPFGDVVSWDLIPHAAIASVALMPGSNPLFGLNTLGGALSVQTKSGLTDPGSAAQLSAGSHGRWQAELTSGGSHAGGLNWFGAANLFRENGWRDGSPSRLGQFFGKLGWRAGATDLTLTASGASTDLYGNGLQDQQLLAQRYESVYTRPDQTRNRAGLASLAATRELDAGWTLSGHAYVRRIDTRSLNGDINDESLDQPLYALGTPDRAALAAAGIAVPTSTDPASQPFPYLQCVARALQQLDTDSACNGVLNRSRSRQSQAGVAMQAAARLPWAGALHQIVVGAAFDASRTSFSQSAEAGFLLPDRSVQTVASFLGDDGEGATDTSIDLASRTRTASVFIADTASFADDRWHLTAAARYNRTTVHNRDQQIHAPDPASLDGDQVFARLNPALGLNWNPGRLLQLYAGVSEGSRTPTAIELGCANPEQPCKLPNALAGDPPLRQVVTRTVEAGLRGDAGAGTTWRAGVFRADNRDDLLFVSSDASGQGYFRNFGKTRRQGIELAATTRISALSIDLAWTLLDARFRSAERLNGAGNSSNDEGPGLDGSIDIAPGDRLPLVPRQIFKAGLGLALSPKLAFDLDVVAIAGAPARGNENGQHAADGTYYLGPGRSAGYAVFNLGASAQATSKVTLFARIGNLFDRRYATAAQLAATGFDGSGRFVAQPLPADGEGRYPLRGSTFFAPGAPRQLSAGIRVAFD